MRRFRLTCLSRISKKTIAIPKTTPAAAASGGVRLKGRIDQAVTAMRITKIPRIISRSFTMKPPSPGSHDAVQARFVGLQYSTAFSGKLVKILGFGVQRRRIALKVGCG
jgi:hypothetical protein